MTKFKQELEAAAEAECLYEQDKLKFKQGARWLLTSEGIKQVEQAHAEVDAKLSLMPIDTRLSIAELRELCTPVRDALTLLREMREGVE